MEQWRGWRPADCTSVCVPTTPLRFDVPRQCKLCGAVGTVSPETTIERGTMSLAWCCRACNGEWPVTRSEQQLIDQRRDLRDGRQKDRDDRRSE
jgi:hypothetical protein